MKPGWVVREFSATECEAALDEMFGAIYAEFARAGYPFALVEGGASRWRKTTAVGAGRVRTLYGAFVAAIERVLGAPRGSIVLADIETLAAWFEDTA